MAVPFRRTSKTKKRMRRTHLKKEVGTLTTCPNCKATLRPHRMCPKCGYYKGKEVIANKVEAEKKVAKKVNESKKIVKKEPKKVTSTPEKVTKKTTLTRTTSK